MQVSLEWPGLPAGVKFDPSDLELLEHLEGKVGLGNSKPHMFIDEFIPTLEENEGICYTHPENLPGKFSCTLVYSRQLHGSEFVITLSSLISNNRNQERRKQHLFFSQDIKCICNWVSQASENQQKQQ